MFEENHELLIEHLSEQITKKVLKVKTIVSQFVFQLISTILLRE
jgi:hypothetical protein